MNNLRDYAPSRAGRPAHGPQGEVTAELNVGSLRVPLSMYEAIIEAAHRVQPTFDQVNQPSKKNKAGYIALLKRGLHQLTISTHSMRLVETSRAIRRLFEGVEELQLDPLPCPRDVDPRWWAAKENERIPGVVRDLRRAVGEALRISRAASEAEKQIGVLAKEGS